MNPRQEEYLVDFLAEWPVKEADCSSDLNADVRVDGGDIGLLVAGWNTPNYDLNGDGNTNGADLGFLLLAWGECD